MVAVIMFASALLPTLANDARAEATFVVDSISDAADINPSDGTCDTDSSTPGNQCTLRAAIQEANAATGADAINFGIPGAGVHTIRLNSQLPTLSDATGPTTIDGYTQPGSSPNTAPLASNAKTMVQIEGGGSDLFGGLVIESPGNIVRGLALYKLRGAIRLLSTDAHNNRIEGNFIGTDATGSYHAAKPISSGYASGVKLAYGASNNIIGGASVADRNVLSGNASHGVSLYDEGTDSNIIVGNLIGLTPSGKGRLANMTVGVDINFGASYNVVGGTLKGERNVISGNGREGVEISHHQDTFPTANQVIGNFIGTNPTGESAPQYARNGPKRSVDAVHIVDGARNSVVAKNVIGNGNQSGVGIDGLNGSYTTGNKVYGNWIGISPGGTAIPNRVAGIRLSSGAKGSLIGPYNVIAKNPVGVQVSGTHTLANVITRNSIFSNTNLGIDLEPLGVKNQKSLTLAKATTQGGATTIRGSLNSTPDNSFIIEFYSNPRSTNQGKLFIGERELITGPDGKVSFVFSPTKVVPSRRNITATATAVGGNTSEFSAPKIVVQR
jgi:CSLREA domain-containing protein